MANNQTINIGIKFNAEMGNVQQSVNQIQQTINKLKMPSDMKQNFTTLFAEFDKTFQKMQTQLNNGFKTKGDVTGLEKTGKELTRIVSNIGKEFNKIDSSVLEKTISSINTEAITKANTQIQELKSNLANLMNTDTDLSKTKSEIESVVTTLQQLSKSKFLTGDKDTAGILNSLNKGDLQSALDAYDKMIAKHKAFNDATKENAWQSQMNLLGSILNSLVSNGSIEKIINQIRELNTVAAEDKKKAIEDLNTQFGQTIPIASAAEGQVTKLTGSLEQAATSQMRLNQATDRFGQRIAYFFSATSAVRLFRRALTQAYTTVKELDAAMTETAVVTNFSVGDMWDQLPEYAKNASELGVSIKDAYESATLYYQQGLKSNQVTQLYNQTLKMARIAGLDASEATDRMTNALRGFNMELNEESATRVADVYSKIASITASNVDEISTAMTKTASLANSANMSFENTAAFLAQIIETTRESADTAGTALKTVIARFAEMKSNPAELVEVEGEEVSFNKVDAALQTVGISLNNFMNGTEGLDSVFMRLSEKWDTLDLATQRYIATMAAGSRQQSRFIALMQNYKRMQELTEAATNASGASNKQYAKTLDSMESKLAKLKNQWNQFTMGLANSKWLKSLIDLATKLLEFLNKITESFGDLGGAIVKVAGLIAVFKLGSLLGNSFKTTVISEFATLGTMGAKATLQHFATGLGAGLPQVLQQKLRLSGKGLMGTSYEKIMIDSTSNNPLAAISKSGGVRTFNTAALAKIPASQIDLTSFENEVQTALQKYQNSTNYDPAKLNEASEAFRDYKASVVNAADGQAIFTQQQELATKINTKLNTNINTSSMYLQTNTATVMQSAMAYAGLAALLAAATSGIANLCKEGSTAQKTWKGLSSAFAIFASVLTIIPPLLKAINVSLGAGPLIAIAAAIAVVAVGITHLIKLAKDRSYEGKLEKITDAQQEFANAIQDSNEKLEDMKSKLEDLREGNDVFEGLTKGSTEFYNRLADANNQILELIEKYPELAKYLTVGEYGQLDLGSGADEYIQGLTEKQQKMQIAATLDDVAIAYLNDQYKGTVLTNLDQNPEASMKAIVDVLENNGYDTTGKDVIYNALVQLLEENGNSTINPETDYMKIRSGIGTVPGIDKVSDELISELINAVNLANTGFNSNISAYSTEITSLLSASLITELNDINFVEGTLGNDVVKALSVAQTETYGKTFNELYNGLLKSNTLEKDFEETFNIDLTNSDKEYSAETMARELANYKIIEQMGKNAQELLTRISNEDNNNTKDLVQIMSNNLEMYDKLNLAATTNQLDPNYINNLITKAIAESGLEEQEFLKLFGFDTVDELKQNLLRRSADLDQLGKQVSDDFNRALGNTFKDIELKKISKKFINTAIAQKQQILNAYNNLINVGVTGIQTFFYSLYDATEEGTQEILDIANSLTKGDAINNYDKLNNYIQNGTETQKSYASNLIKDEAFGSGKQLQQYLASSEYSDQDKAIRKKMKKNDFTTSDIEDMAQDSELLSTLLDNNVIGAESLVQVITKLKNGQISVEGLTNRVTEAIKEFRSLDNIAEEAASTIEKANFGVSSSGLVTSLKEQSDDLKALQDLNALGDTQVKNYIRYFFDEEYANKILSGTAYEFGSSLREQISGAIDLINRWNTGNGINFVEDYANAPEKQVEGLSIYKNAYGEYMATIQSGVTAEEYINRIAEAWHLSEVEATAYFQKITSLAPEIAQEIDKANYDQALEKLINKTEKLGETGREQIEYTAAEIKVLEEFTNKSWDEIRKDIAKGIGIDENLIVKVDVEAVLDKEGIEKQIAEINTQFGIDVEDKTGLLEKWGVLTDVGGTIYIDGSGLLEKLEQYGMSEADAKNFGEGWAGELDGVFSQAVEYYTWEENELVRDQEMVYAESLDELDSEVAKMESIFEASAWYELIASAVAEGTKAGNGDTEAKLKAGTDKAKTSTKEQQEGKEKIEKILDPIYDEKANSLSRNQQNLYYQLKQDGKYLEAKALIDSIQGTTGTTTTQQQDKDAANPEHYTAKNQSTSNKSYALNFSQSDKDEGSGKKDEKETKQSTGEIKNDFDKLYNILSKMKTLQEQMVYYTKAYANMTKYGASIKGSDYGISDLIDNRLVRLQKYNAEIQTLQTEKSQSSSAAAALAKQFSQYISYDKKTNRVAINYEEIDKLAGKFDTSTDESKEKYNTQKEYYDSVKDAVSKVEGYASNVKSSNEELYEIQSAVEELKREGLNEYLELEQRVATALENIETQEVDKLESVANAIKDSNEQIINKMQQQIDEQRKTREQNKAQQELDKKRRQLIYLQQDTSGGNRQEILKLQEEIANAEEDYTDTLIDNVIDKLTKQNEEFAEKSDAQIELLREIITWNKESGAYNQAAFGAIVRSFDESGHFLMEDSAVYQALYRGEGWSKDTAIALTSTTSDLQTGIVTAGEYLVTHWDKLAYLSTYVTGTDLSTLEEKLGKKLVGSNSETPLAKYVANNGDKLDTISTSETTITGKLDTILTRLETINRSIGNISFSDSSSNSVVTSDNTSNDSSDGTQNQKNNGGSNGSSNNSAKIKTLQKFLNKYFAAGLAEDGIYGSATKSAVKSMQTAVGSSADGLYGSKTMALLKKWMTDRKISGSVPMPIYEQGGLVDFTGLAWMDGTKADPEMVLNSRQTAMFDQFIDLLDNINYSLWESRVENAINRESQNSGSIYYDIDINIDEIANESNVDSMIEKMKSEIISAARKSGFSNSSVYY